MEDNVSESEKPIAETNDNVIQYIECTRLVEGGNLRRFETIVAKFDVVQHEFDYQVAKPLLFFAIEHNDEIFVKTLLDMEIPYEKSYPVVLQTNSGQSNSTISRYFNAYEYACELKFYHLADLIRQRSRYLPFDQRYMRVLQTNDVRRCDAFLHQLRNERRQQQLAEEGLFCAAQFGSIRLLDFFLTRWKLSVNFERKVSENHSATPLLVAITFNQMEAAKFLLFRNADPSIKGEYDNALVTALHYQSSHDLIRLLLDKHVDITARHPDYKRFSLREYCIATNRVKAKLELDAYILRLISSGNYKRLKWLVDHGYKHINVYISHKRYGRNLAKERYQEKIVKLIDDIDAVQKRNKQKMNY